MTTVEQQMSEVKSRLRAMDSVPVGDKVHNCCAYSNAVSNAIQLRTLTYNNKPLKKSIAKAGGIGDM